MQEKKNPSKVDLETAVEMVYELALERGKLQVPEANRILMNDIKELGLDERSAQDCWNLLWRKHKKVLVELGYPLGY